MATTVILTNGNSEHQVSLVYDAASQTDFNIRRGGTLSSPVIDVLTHQSDRQDGALPVHVSHADREAFFTLMVNGADWDAVLANVSRVQNLLNDASRYWTDGDVDKVYLQVQFNGATSPTYIDVKWGQLDTGPLWSSASQLNVRGINLPVNLTLAPFGYGDEIDLENLGDNPGFEEWHGGTTDAQPDSWSDEEDAGITGTNNQESSTVKFGQYALRTAVTGSTGANLDKGVQQTVVAGRLTPGGSYTLVCWYKTAGITAGAAQIGVEGTNTGSQWAVNSSAAASDWTVAAVAFTMHASDTTLDIHARVRSSGSGCSGTLYVGGLMLLAGDYETEAEAGLLPWMSGSYIVNHYDDDAGDINYVDVADMPGDAIAEAQVVFQPVTASSYDQVFFGVFGAKLGGAVPVMEDNFYFDYSGTTDSGSSGGEYTQISVSGTMPYQSVTLTNLPDGDELRNKTGLFVLRMNNQTGTDVVRVRISLSYGSYHFYTSEWIDADPGTAFTIMQIASLFMTWSKYGAADLDVVAQFNRNDTTQTIRVDFMQYLPLDHGGGIIQVTSVSDEGAAWSGFTETEKVIIPQRAQDVILVTGSSETIMGKTTIIGRGPQLQAQRGNRIIFLWLRDGGSHVIADEAKVIVRYRPRSNHLLGAG